jgi:nucleotidyltransferase substrate binding protein (TIGR01987 family)
VAESYPPLDFSSLARALDALEAVLARVADARFWSAQDDITRRAMEAGAIQHFEFTYELAWKAMRRVLARDFGAMEVDGASRAELFRLAARRGLIHDVAAWMDFHQARNRTSHTYDNAAAVEVLAIVRRFPEPARALLSRLRTER